MRAEFQGISHEIFADLRDPFRVRTARCGCEFRFQDDAFFIRQRLKQREVLPADLRQIAGAELEILPINIEQGKFQQRVDERMHASRGPLAGLDRRAVFLHTAVAGKGELGLAENDRDRRAEFVCGIRSETRLLGERVIEPLEGVVEDGGKLAEFALRFTGEEF